MPKRPKDLRRRMAAICARRPALQRQAEQVLLAHYRKHRRLPRGPLCSFVGSRRLYKIIKRGEVEHVLGVAGATLDYNPCLGCKLCVAVCPVQAIAPNGAFNFSACYNHNYREFLGGFVDWVETIADSKTADEYSTRVALHETTSMWQSLSFKPSYKAAFCLAVCPAGDDVLSPF
jgi:ferredoxin